METDVERIHVYRYCPRCGTQPMEIRPPHLTMCAFCGLELFHNAAAAAAVILVDREDRTLLIRRAHEPAKGKLGFAGGFVDNGESVEAGLRREVREETGLEISSLTFLTSHPNVYPYRGVIYHTIDMFFVAHVADFRGALPLDAVAELVVMPIADVRGDELAFVSLQVAWRAFRTQDPSR
jgi:ADP-ribose pyrophosphatase YjhB (NUDIX family)